MNNKPVLSSKYKVHMLFPGAGFGGSGRRLYFLACILASKDREFYVYAADETLSRLNSNIEETETSYVKFISIGKWSDSQAERDRCAKRKIVQRYASGDVIHLTASHPFFLGPKYRTLYSCIGVYLPFASKISHLNEKIKSSSKKKVKIRYSLYSAALIERNSISTWGDRISSIVSDFRSWIAIFGANHVDVLNPKNYLIIRKLKKFQRISCTAGLSPHSPVGKTYQRVDKVVFLGRLEWQKGIDFLLEVLETLDKLLAKKTLEVEVHIVGEGSLSSVINSFLKDRSFSQLRVFSYWSNDVHQVLKDAKVFVSLQRYSNYPSRALVEAMCHGVVPVISNTGDSRLMVPRGYPYLIEEEALSHTLAPCLVKLISMSFVDYQNLSEEIADFMAVKSSPERQSRYYGRLYDRLHVS